MSLDNFALRHGSFGMHLLSFFYNKIMLCFMHTPLHTSTQDYHLPLIHVAFNCKTGCEDDDGGKKQNENEDVKREQVLLQQ